MSFINQTSYLIYSIAALTILLSGVAIYSEYRKAKATQTKRIAESRRYRKVRHVAILIATKNGESTIEATVRAALANKVDVYVISDGSTDKTVNRAWKAGAIVHSLKKNVGKPAALHSGYDYFKLGKRYDAIAILDDDVVIAKDFISQAKKTMDRGCAIAVGKNLTDWPKSNFWNIWLASRAYSYWAYQITLRTIQSSYNIMTCISGSNSLYRTEVLSKVLSKNTPYIVDDTFWTLETHRLKLGTIKYSPKAKAVLQDPTNFHDWYKQNLRWMWGTFQGIIGHRVGTKPNRLHISYLALMLDWIIYIFSAPLTLFIIWQAGIHNLPMELGLLCAGYAVWVTIAAIALKLPRLILFIPAIVVVDFMFRWVMVHGLIKAIRQKTVENCVWESPKRLDKSMATGVN
jgi:poly-beta-1,6-N-acetyl-D-glucosamine synthase